MYRFSKNPQAQCLFVAFLATLVSVPMVAAQLAVSANDNKGILVDGVVTVVQSGQDASHQTGRSADRSLVARAGLHVRQPIHLGTEYG